MFGILRSKRIGKRARAIRNGQLVDMQLPPFRQFNEIFQNDLTMVMTKAAYQACVELPGERRGKATVPANARWGIVFLSFMEQFQNRSDNPVEGVFDVNVLMPDGFQASKSLKVVADNDFDGKNAFVFMLLEELWPDCLPNYQVDRAGCLLKAPYVAPSRLAHTSRYLSATPDQDE